MFLRFRLAGLNKRPSPMLALSAPLFMLFACFGGEMASLCAQEEPGTATFATAENQDDGDAFIKLAEKQDLNIGVLINMLAEQLGNPIYGHEIDFPQTTEKLVFIGDVKIQKKQFFEFVQVILRNRNSAIVKSSFEGMYKVVPLSKVPPHVPTARGDQENANLHRGEYVNAIFKLKYISADEAIKYLNRYVVPTFAADNRNQPTMDKFLTNMLIVTEMAARIDDIRAAIALIDLPPRDIVTEFLPVNHLAANAFKGQLDAILKAQQSAQSGTAAGKGDGGKRDLDIVVDERTNRLILIGTRTAIDGVMGLIRELDKPLELAVRKHSFENQIALRVDALIRATLPQQEELLQRIYQSAVQEDDRVLVVTAGEKIHDRIDQIKLQIDQEGAGASAASPMKFYKLNHVKAADILSTLQRAGNQSLQASRSSRERRQNSIRQGINGIPGGSNNQQNQGFNQQGGGGQSGGFQNTPFNAPNSGRSNQAGQSETPVRGGANNIIPNATITISESTNTLIIVADAATHKLYEQLIKKLDVYQPSVMIEVTFVTVDEQEDLSIGVEVSGGDRAGGKRLFGFSNFGLSDTISGTSGALTISPGLGFNGTLVDPGIADVVLRALATNRHARVETPVTILVNDNELGLLSSVAEQPFTSINTSNTVSTTSFAGFATAGTTVAVTPSISEGNYLNLEFDVLINDFTGSGSENIPPPRNTDQVSSKVTIPNGHTVIVGGLSRKRKGSGTQGIPILKDIPIIKLLASNNSEGTRNQRLYVFIKPIILRDGEKFRDSAASFECRNARCVPIGRFSYQ